MLNFVKRFICTLTAKIFSSGKNDCPVRTQKPESSFNESIFNFERPEGPGDVIIFDGNGFDWGCDYLIECVDPARSDCWIVRIIATHGLTIPNYEELVFTVKKKIVEKHFCKLPDHNFDPQMSLFHNFNINSPEIMIVNGES